MMAVDRPGSTIGRPQPESINNKRAVISAAQSMFASLNSECRLSVLPRQRGRLRQSIGQRG